MIKTQFTQINSEIKQFKQAIYTLIKTDLIASPSHIAVTQHEHIANDELLLDNIGEPCRKDNIWILNLHGIL